MINDIAHARSYARGLKRILRPVGVGHLAAHDMAARTLGERDWRSLDASAGRDGLHAERQEVEERLRAELAVHEGVDADAAVATLLPPVRPAGLEWQDLLDDAEPLDVRGDAPVIDVDGIPEPLPLTPKVAPSPESMVVTPDDQTWDRRWRDPMQAFSARQLGCIAKSLLREPHAPLRGVHRRIDETMRRGWFMQHDVEDILHDWDMRVDRHRIGMPVTTLMRGLGFEWSNLVHRPGARENSCIVYQGLDPATFAALCIVLEQLGFRTPAADMVDRTAAELKRKRMLTEHELRVHWYKKEGLRMRNTFLAPDRGDALTHLEGRLPDGHRYEFTTCGGGVARMEIRGPRYRRSSRD